MPKDTQVTIVGATMPDELIVDTLQDMLPVRCSLHISEQLGFQLVLIDRFSNEFFRLLLSTFISGRCGGLIWLARLSPDRAVRVRVLAGDIVLCSWARHFTLTVPLSTQVYKWVPANLMLGVTLRCTAIPSRGE